ncbi:unnamed protein product [Trichogramma brassicae]|uniref:Uncharacterized protein n=1 Tax=Trichogramma brassicae TaxID=86971 RepID=A0A6H5HXT2_9HYME|nr:unnamed protein product [Trichogramma brassicae]
MLAPAISGRVCEPAGKERRRSAISGVHQYTPVHDGGEDLPLVIEASHAPVMTDGHEARRHILRGPGSDRRAGHDGRETVHIESTGRSTCSSGASRACSRPRRPRSRRRWPGGRCAYKTRSPSMTIREA